MSGIENILSAVKKLGYKTSGRTIYSSQGRIHDWIIDLRSVFLNGSHLKEIAEEFWIRYADRAAFQIGTLETAGIPLLTALMLTAPARHGDINGFIIRKTRKISGLAQIVEGSINNLPIILIDDLFNSGTSAERARVVLQAEGHDIQEMFVVVDYHSQLGDAWRNLHSVSVTSLLSLSDFEIERNPRPPMASRHYRMLWHAKVEGANPTLIYPKSTPLVVGDRIYRGSDSGHMHCFDLASGDIIWDFEATGCPRIRGIWSSPSFHDGKIFFGAYNGVAYCLDAADGSVIWGKAVCEWIGGSPLIIARHGLVVYGLQHERPWAKGSLAALRIEDGGKVWEIATDRYQHCSASYWAAGDLIVWGSADHETVGVKPETGDVFWRFPTRRSCKAVPCIDDARGISGFASYDQSIYAINLADGSKIGEWETGNLCYTTPLIIGNKMFCGSQDKKMYVIDLDSRSIISTLDVHARVFSSPTLIGESVFFGTTGGRVIEMNSETLDVEGILQVPDSVTNAIVACPNSDRFLVSTYMNDLFMFQGERGH